jgi:cytoskeletal protein CcmA (bactofilin family)
MGIFGKPPDSKPGDPVSPPVRPVVHAPSPSPPPSPSPSPSAPPAPALAPRAGTAACVVGANTIFKGEISGDEDVLVEGTVEGQIRVTRDLRVGPAGKVKATIAAQSVIVSGEIIGDCEAATRVEIHATGRLTGNIRAPRIVVAEGAMFRGNSDMSNRKDERKDKVAIS